MRFPVSTAAVCLAVWLGQPYPSPGEEEMVLGQAGQLQRALTGSYGELFADASSADAGTPVLALETRAPGAEAARVLVPGTLDARTETAPLLFQDSHHDSFVVLWRSLAGEDGGGSHLSFATFDGAEWSEVFRLERDGVPVALAGEPLIAETHDTFEIRLEDGEPIRAERRVVHLLWHGDEATPLTHYAPLIFVEGRYVGWHSHFVLNDSFLLAPESAGEEDDGGEAAPAPELTAALAGALDLETAADGRSVLVTFANPASHRLGTLEISPLPLSLELLGEAVREQVLAHADLFDPGDLGAFADGIRAAIVIMGQLYELHDAQADFVAGGVADWILASDGEYGWADLERLGDDARDVAVDRGREVTLSRQADPAGAGSEIVRIDVSAWLEGLEPEAPRVFDFRLRRDLPAPAIGDGPVRVHVSRDGADLLVAWEDEENGVIHWVESRHPDAWGETFSLATGEDLDLETGHRLLARKIR